MNDFLNFFSDKEYAFALLYKENTEGCDIQSQLSAIRTLLENLKRLEISDAEGLRRREAQASLLTGQAGDHADEHINDLYHQSVYDDAARSMAAASLLVPFIEMLFSRLFSDNDLKNKFQKSIIKNHIRLNLGSKKFWDCKEFYRNANKPGGIAKGIPQLCEAVGLDKYMPQDFKIVIEILFLYRNNNFHNGFEWPSQTRLKFTQEIQSLNCNLSWFQMSKYGNNSWIFYLSQDFIDYLLDFIELILCGVGAYVRQLDKGIQ